MDTDKHGASTEIEVSGRLPLLVLFISAAVWAVIGSAFGLMASIKFHSPAFLADQAWLTYGRVYAVYTNSLLYGFALQAGLGFALWLLSRLGQARLTPDWLVLLGAIFLNLGITLGVIYILAGDSTGFVNLEMPGYAARLLFLGYLLIALSGLITFHYRQERLLFVSQWFVLTALFWFAWVYSTAEVLLVISPVRGVTQAVVSWWYSDNLLVVWLGLVGLAAAFYFVPKLLRRDLHSHYLALLAYWVLVLVASWGGIPNTAPVPAWMPAASTVATMISLILLLAVALNVYGTTGGFALVRESSPLSFILFGVGAFLVAGALRIAAVLETTHTLQFSWYTPAQNQLQFYGFFAMILFGAIYYILPRVVGLAFPFPKLVRAHFWLAALGIVLIFLPLTIGGVVQTQKMLDPKLPFVDVVKATLPFLRASTVGDLLLFLGHLLFLGNVVGLTVRFYRSLAVEAYDEVTADLFKSAGAKT